MITDTGAWGRGFSYLDPLVAGDGVDIAVI